MGSKHANSETAEAVTNNPRKSVEGVVTFSSMKKSSLIASVPVDLACRFNEYVTDHGSRKNVVMTLILCKEFGIDPAKYGINVK